MSYWTLSGAIFYHLYAYVKGLNISSALYYRDIGSSGLAFLA